MVNIMCDTCKHLRAVYIDLPKQKAIWKCDAYPEGIPEKYYTGKEPHYETDGKDNGIVYEPVVKDKKTLNKNVKHGLIENGKVILEY